MRRILAFCALLIGLVSLAPAHPIGQQRPTISDDLLAARKRGERMRIIVQSADPEVSLTRHARGLLRREFQGGLALDVSKDDFDALAKDPSIAHISRDIPVNGDMAVTNKVTDATSVWAGTPGLLGLLGTPGYKGSGITVAVLDSGIAAHSALDTRVVAHVDFVSFEGPVNGDPYGHGTHVAGIIAGNTTAAKYVTTAFAGGSAPAVKLVDVRVLGRQGQGMTSDVIAGIDWAIANRLQYGGIKVLNLSLGHPVAESEVTDPLCRAVKRAVDVGLVVVVSAGNYGQTSTGAPILGGISSPGNSQYALTVGALDTMGTESRTDDRIAPYSSKGPTRFDFAVKPDVVAPGTKITSLESPGSYIVGTYPTWHVAGSAKNAYLRLSGTSMSTAVVSGGVALMLQAHPNMSPGQVKVAMQMGSVFVGQGGLVGAGAGSVNFQSAMKVADNGLLTNLLSTVTSILGLSSGAAFHDTSNGTGTLINRVYDRTGIKLLGILDLSILFGSNGGEAGVLNLLGTANPLGSTAANYVVWGDVAKWSDSYYVVWGDSIQSPSGQYVVWGDSYDDGDYVVWGNSLPDNSTPGGR